MRMKSPPRVLTDPFDGHNNSRHKQRLPRRTDVFAATRESRMIECECNCKNEVWFQLVPSGPPNFRDRSTRLAMLALMECFHRRLPNAEECLRFAFHTRQKRVDADCSLGTSRMSEVVLHRYSQRHAASRPTLPAQTSNLLRTEFAFFTSRRRSSRTDPSQSKRTQFFFLFRRRTTKITSSRSNAMMKYICLALFLVHDSSVVVESFTPAAGGRQRPGTTTTILYSTLSSPNNAGSRFFRGDLMDDGHLILNQAREIAFGSDEVLALEAPILLNKLLELESDCSSGKRLGEDVCDLSNYDGEDGSLVEIVAQLRVKAATADAIRYVLCGHSC
jgi:hypothetical protein